MVERRLGPAAYGKVHEYGGEQAYDILPSRAKVLRFIKDGQTVFARAVHHPPLPQRSFMEASLDDMKDEIVLAIKVAFRDAIQES